MPDSPIVLPSPNEFAQRNGYRPFPPRWERFLSELRNEIVTAQPMSGRNTTVDVHPGKGTVINIFDTSSRGVQPPPTNTGACCFDDGSCEVETEDQCASDGGTYQGGGTVCDPNPCPQPTGACCVESDCSVQTESDCTDMGGTYQGNDTTCDPNPCPQQPTGACCVGTDCSIQTESDCTDMGGTYQGDDTNCDDPNPCTTPSCGGCGFVNPDDGNTYLTKTHHYTIDASGCPDDGFCCPCAQPGCEFGGGPCGCNHWYFRSFRVESDVSVESYDVDCNLTTTYEDVSIDTSCCCFRFGDEVCDPPDSSCQGCIDHNPIFFSDCATVTDTPTYSDPCIP